MSFGFVGIAVRGAEKLNCAETAFVDIEVDVALLKVWRTGLPDNGFRIHTLHLTPCGKTDPPAVSFRIDEEKVKVMAELVSSDFRLLETISSLGAVIAILTIGALMASPAL